MHGHERNDLDGFLEEMRAQIHATPLPTARTSAWAGARSALAARWRLASGAGLAVAAVAAALVIALASGSRPPAAFAAVEHGDRSVTVTLREFRSIPQLNARLHRLGTRIRVVPVTRGCVAPVHVTENGHVVPGAARTLRAYRVTLTYSMTIAVNTLPGRTFVIPAMRSGLTGDETVVVGPAPRCVATG